MPKGSGNKRLCVVLSYVCIDVTQLPLKVSVNLEHDADGIFAFSPDLPGCYSQGKTVAEAVENMKEAVSLYIEEMPEADRKALSQREVMLLEVPGV